jgi:hypothetical protein
LAKYEIANLDLKITASLIYRINLKQLIVTLKRIVYLKKKKTIIDILVVKMTLKLIIIGT